MNINAAEGNKHRFIATTISIVSICILLCIVILYSIKTPAKPLEKGAIEIAEFDLSQALTSMSQGNSVNQHQHVKTAAISSSPEKSSEQTAQKTTAQLLTEKFIAGNEKPILNNGKSEGESEGLSKEPKGQEGTIGETGSSIPGFGIELSGRKVISNPDISKDTKEQGKVVVEITVDQNGTVIKAEPNGRGTTTSSSILKEKARAAALKTKFNTSVVGEQKGTITLIFSF